ncbi:MAG: hypothetical protein FJ116_05055 [Deltaproteobacteria bacterium]|nr:hypothetical protein [Deltaproteobacteria bacterium]
MLAMIQFQSKNNFHVFCLIIIVSIFTFLQVGSFESRLANSSGDDHPMVWARFIKNPQFWSSDSNFANANALARASLPNLLTTLSMGWDERLPKILCWAYVLFQNVGLALALFAFCQLFQKNSVLSAIVVILTLLMEPWGLNLAYYPSMMHSPYPGHLVMPLLVFASLALMRNFHRWMMVLLILASLIHPSQTLHLMTLAGCYQFIRERKIEFKNYRFFILPTLCTLVIPFLLIPKAKNPLTDLELIPSALNNAHLVPWSTNIFWPWGVPTMIMIFGLSWFAVRSDWGRALKLYSFWGANFISFLVLGILHIVGVAFKILPIILLCPLRITVINSVLLVPIIFSFLITCIFKGKGGNSFTAATLLTLMVFSKRGFFWGPLLILIFSNSESKKRNISLQAWVLTAIWWLVFLLFGRPLREIFGESLSETLRNLMAPGFSLVSWQIYFSISLSILASFYCNLEKKGLQFLKESILIALIIIGVGRYYWVGRQAFEGELGAMFEVQMWASNFTPKDSMFLIEGSSWRGISERRAQVIGLRKNRILPYLRDREPMILEEKINDLYSEFKVGEYRDLSDKQIKWLAVKFNADYFLDSYSTPLKKSLRVAYENKMWRVYNLRSNKKDQLDLDYIQQEIPPK